MGEASIKVNHNGNGADKRVLQLRDEIARKREKITVELDELRRRRAEAVVTAKNGAKFAGAGLVGFLVMGSLVNALRDLGRDDDEEDVKVIVQREDEEKSFLAIVMSALLSMAVNELRGYAMDYARTKLREKLNDQRNDQRAA